VSIREFPFGFRLNGSRAFHMTIWFMIVWAAVASAFGSYASAGEGFSGAAYGGRSGPGGPAPDALDYQGADGEWADIFGRPGVNGPVYALALHEDMLIVGGAFERAGHIEAPYLVGWTGSDWVALGDPEWGAGGGAGNAAIHAIHMYGDTLVVGGRIRGGAVNDVIAAWDGDSWIGLGDLGDPTVSTVKAFVEFDGELVAAGFIPPKRYVAAYSGGTWSTLGSGMNGEVLALEVFEGDLVAAGRFTEADDKPARRIARWDGSSWSELGGGLDGSIYALAAYGGRLVAAGDFTGYIAVWDGASWTTASPGIPSLVRTLGICRTGGADSLLYGGGGAALSGFVIKNRDASCIDWDVVTVELDSPVYEMGACPGDSVIYLGGEFTTVDTLEAFHIAELEGQTFVHLGPEGYGLGSDVEVLGVYRDDLIAVTSERSVLAWDGTAWDVLAEAANDQINAVISHGDYLFVAGIFTAIDGQSLSRIARWNGTSWSALGAGLSGVVYDLVIYEGNLIAGGSFHQAGTVAADNIAMWDGSMWSEFGEGREHPVDRVTVWNGRVVVSVRNTIQIRDGAFWRLIGNMRAGTIRCLDSYGSLLVAAGDFYEIGDVSARRIAVWDGESWSPMGEGLEGNTGWPNYWGGVFGFTIYNGNPVAGGYFDSPCYNIARWDGFSWQCLGETDSTVHALTNWNGSLVAGGTFGVVSGLSSYGVAAWDDFVDPLDSLTADGRDEAILISWHTPADPAYHGTMIRYRLDEYPTDPADGLPVPNGNGGLFDGSPDSDSTFLHPGLPSDMTHYYTGFNYDDLGHFSSAVFVSATTLDKNPPDTVSHFTVTPGLDYLHLRWTNPVTEDYQGTLIRYSTGGYPAHPDSGSPVPNDSEGRFEGLPGSEGSFIHSGVEVARTHYYSAFAYDHELNHASPVGAQGLVADVFAPELELAIFQNPYLTRYLDIYLLSSEPLDAGSVHLKPGSDSIGVEPVQGRSDIWLGQYELAGPGGRITINGCAADTSGNHVCEADTFSTGFISGKHGGSVVSADGWLRLVVPPAAFPGDDYIVIMSGRPQALSRAADSLTASRVPGEKDGWEASNGPVYRVTPAGILKDSKARIEISYAGNAQAAEGAPDKYYIEQTGIGPLESFVDPKRLTVTAEIKSLGTFRLAQGDPGSSEIVDPGFLRLEACRPNPMRGSTTITFRIKAAQHVRLALYDIEGRLVEDLIDRRLDPGSHSIMWDGESSSAEGIASGIYFLRFVTDHGEHTRKLTIIR